MAEYSSGFSAARFAGAERPAAVSSSITAAQNSAPVQKAIIGTATGKPDGSTASDSVSALSPARPSYRRTVLRWSVSDLTERIAPVVSRGAVDAARRQSDSETGTRWISSRKYGEPPDCESSTWWRRWADDSV